MNKYTVKTIGYGGLSVPEKFLERVVANGIIFVFDIRRYGSGAFLNIYRPDQIWKLLHREGITHCHFGELGKEENLPMADYKRIKLATPEAEALLKCMAFTFKATLGHAAILCAERDVYKSDEVECHRAYVAAALVELLGDEWEVQHI